MFLEATDKPPFDVEGDDGEGQEGGGGDDEMGDMPPMDAPMGEDPTQTPGDDAPNPDDLAGNEKGVYVSDVKFASLVKLLLKAMSSGSVDIPQQFQTVTTDNADDIISFAEQYYKLGNIDREANSMLGKIK